SAAGLFITESVLSLMALMNPTPIWVMGIDASSTNQLEARVGKSPVYYQNGVVLINLKHGPAKAFEFWDKSSIRKILLGGEDYAWSELELPAMMPRAADLIGSMPLHTVIDQGHLLGSGVAIGTRTVAQTYRGIAGRKLAALESSK
ncbi:MAG: hypothetical protein KAX57_06275, partial [Rhodoferax sp.]|nr:hypothetical protein [Rhodoferax sp.]